MRKVLILGLIAVFLMVASAGFAAYPEKGVTVICPWGAGGGTDRVARFMAAELEKAYGEPFVVVNKTGGGGAVGHGAGAYAKADGYNITLLTLEITTMHWMGLTKLTYDDFDYVIQINQDPSAVMVRSDAPWKGVKDLLNDVKANPGKYKFSGSGAGTIWDLSRIGMFDKVGIPVDAATWIPTKGAAPSIVELLGGHVDVITCSLPEAAAQVESGEFKALAIMADTRDTRFPDVPTLKEQGIDWSSGTFRGIAVPKGTPKEIVESLYETCNKIVTSDAYKDFMNKNGFGIKIRNSEEFYNFCKEQDMTWKKVLELGGYAK